MDTPDFEKRKLKLEKEKLAFEKRKFDADEERRNLEAAKLREEVRETRKAWYRKPAYLTPVTTVIVAVIGGSIAFGTDVLKSNVVALRKERQELSPIVEALQKDYKTLSTEIRSLQKSATVLATELSEKLGEAQKEVARLEEREKIVALGDSAIDEASHAALRDLKRLAKDPQYGARKKLAGAEIGRVASYWGVLHTLSSEYHLPVEPGKRENDLTTCDLLKFLRADNWKDRARSAQLLAGRAVKGVPEALLDAMEDRHLQVMRDAATAFQMETGYPEMEVFPDVEVTRKWWAENRQRVTAKFAVPTCK